MSSDKYEGSEFNEEEVIKEYTGEEYDIESSTVYDFLDFIDEMDLGYKSFSTDDITDEVLACIGTSKETGEAASWVINENAKVIMFNKIGDDL